MRDLVVRLLHARGDHFVAVLAAGTQAPFEFVDRRRQDENANRLRPFALDLARALPIDVEDDIVAGVEQRARFGKPGAIATTETFGLFEEISARNLLGKTGPVDEGILTPIQPPRPP